MTQVRCIETLVHKSMIKKVDRLKLSIEGDISDEQAEKIWVIKAHYDAIVLCKNDLEQLIKELAQEYQSQIELIQTVPGFKKELTSIRLISEIDRKSTRLNSSHVAISYAVFCLKKKINISNDYTCTTSS